MGEGAIEAAAINAAAINAAHITYSPLMVRFGSMSITLLVGALYALLIGVMLW